MNSVEFERMLSTRATGHQEEPCLRDLIFMHFQRKLQNDPAAMRAMKDYTDDLYKKLGVK